MNQSSSSIIPYLFLATFVLVLAYGIWQYFKAKKAKAEGHTSASARQGKPAGGHTSDVSARSATGSAAPSAGKEPPIVPR